MVPPLSFQRIGRAACFSRSLASIPNLDIENPVGPSCSRGFPFDRYRARRWNVAQSQRPCKVLEGDPALSITDDVDSDLLISRLAGPLPPGARQAFRRAAEDALARLPCAGEGVVYRTVAPLQRAYFDPPNDYRAAWDISHERWTSKLVQQPALEHDRDRRRARRG